MIISKSNNNKKMATDGTNSPGIDSLVSMNEIRVRENNDDEGL